MITIIGTGALASLFAARLASKECNVSDVARRQESSHSLIMFGSWREAIEAINTAGLILEDDSGSRAFRVKATSDVRECEGADLALVLVKSYQTEKVAKEIKKFLSPDGVALTLQNGLGNYEALANELGEERVAQGVAMQGANMIEAGRVRDGGKGSIHVAEHPRLTKWVDVLRNANIEVHESPISDLQSLVWNKLLINVPINPLTALLRLTNGEFLKREDALKVGDHAVDECLAVMVAKGITPPRHSPHDRYREVLFNTSTNRSSMFQDILRGAQTEIESINGAVVREGKKTGRANFY
ncbi:MAG: 2-dehydropantoate 2-reductase [Chloroflexi bacterium]|nr:2-dehydropantoate 2-reductase [Chloroflexota bacterium]